MSLMQTEIRPHDLAGAAEIAMLEEAFEDALKCESEHSASSGPCTVKVVALGRDCVHSLKLCESARSYHLFLMSLGTVSCAGCRKKVADCWRIIPI